MSLSSMLVGVLLWGIVELYLKYKDEKSGYKPIKKEDLSYEDIERFFIKYVFLFFIMASFGFIFNFAFSALKVLNLYPSLNIEALFNMFTVGYIAALFFLMSRFLTKDLFYKKDPLL